jgi:hypothetical protein
LRNVIFFLGLLAVGAAAQTAPPQPYDVKGVRLGSSLADWKSGTGSACMEMPAGKPAESAFICPGATYAGIKLQEIVNFYKGRLTSFYFKFSHDDYDALRDALKQKFGPPSQTEQKKYQNGYGTTFNGEYSLWVNGPTSITLEEVGGDRDHSILLFAHNEILAEKEKDKKAKTKPDDM